jgi:predicted small secreted protein
MSNSSTRSNPVRIARTLLLLGLAGAACTLAACQTVKGLGSDIQYAGEKTEQAIVDGKK